MPLSSLLAIITLTAAALAAAGLYIYKVQRGGESSGLFTPRLRRLAFIERAYLDGGRKLVLVRRDNVEHLILIGGPVDLVIETGIRPEHLVNGAAAEEEDEGFAASHSETPAGWRLPEATSPAAKDAAPAGPRLSLTPEVKETVEEMLELTPLQEAKTAH